MPRCDGAATDPVRSPRGRRAEIRGREAEDRAASALAGDGWTILARRLRTPHGELDLVASRDGLFAFVEVKARPTLAEAAYSLGPVQRRRLAAAAEAAIAQNPEWRPDGIRFDVILVDAEGRVRRIADAFRPED